MTDMSFNRLHHYRRFFRNSALVGAVLLQTGCYTYLPMQANLPAPESPQARTGIVLNDRGREILADRVGPLMDRIEGRIDRRENGAVTVSVYRVVNLRGEASTWTGEMVSIPEDGIQGYRTRKFSVGRTAVLVGAVAAAIAITLRVSFSIFGTPSLPGPGPEPEPS